MKILKTTTFSTLGFVSLALLVSACGNAANTNTTNNSAANTASQPVAVTTPVANAAQSPASKSEGDKIQGELQIGKSESVVLYVGKETGDYAGYCFANDSESGRAILGACKDKEQCEVIGKVDYDSACKVPGLEATLSQSGKIVKVESAKSLGRTKS